MPFISINADFSQILDDIHRKQQESSQWNYNALNEITDLFVNTAKSKVHVITGKTKDSIRKVSVTQKQAIIQADWGAKWEERRTGSKDGTPHKFGTETINEIIPKGQEIIRKHYKL
jgi:hypothetical protein